MHVEDLNGEQSQSACTGKSLYGNPDNNKVDVDLQDEREHQLQKRAHPKFTTAQLRALNSYFITCRYPDQDDNDKVANSKESTVIPSYQQDEYNGLE